MSRRLAKVDDDFTIERVYAPEQRGQQSIGAFNCSKPGAARLSDLSRQHSS